MLGRSIGVLPKSLGGFKSGILVESLDRGRFSYAWPTMGESISFRSACPTEIRSTNG